MINSRDTMNNSYVTKAPHMLQPVGLSTSGDFNRSPIMPSLFLRNASTSLTHSLGLSDRSSDSLQSSMHGDLHTTESHKLLGNFSFGDNSSVGSSFHSPLFVTMQGLAINQGLSSAGEPSLSPTASLIARTTLPAWAVDLKGQYVVVPLSEVVARDQLVHFACDKIGCHFLQQNYPATGTPERNAVLEQILKQPTIFDQLCSDVFANFYIQCIVQEASKDQNFREQQLLVENIKRNVHEKALNRYSCRVVQKAVECLHQDLTIELLNELVKTDLVPLCVDQNANHVIQKIVSVFQPVGWCRLVERLLCEPKSILEVSENKYGCRVIQLFLEQLCEKNKEPVCARLLQRLMEVVMSNCERMAANEFANYVIQHIVKTGPLAEYRNKIIDNCLLRNLLSMSQEKYASHVVETALENAPPQLLKDMMEELFDGYVPHPETKKDALDILMFHQYGNYVVQRMLNICCQAYRAKLSGIKLPDAALRMEWLRRLQHRILDNEPRLSRYSSGKKIIAMLHALPGVTLVPATRSSHTNSSVLPPLGISPPVYANNNVHAANFFAIGNLTQGSNSPRSLSTSPPSNAASLSSSDNGLLNSPFFQSPMTSFHLHQQQPNFDMLPFHLSLPSIHGLRAQGGHAYSAGPTFSTSHTNTSGRSQHDYPSAGNHHHVGTQDVFRHSKGNQSTNHDNHNAKNNKELSIY